MKAVAFELYPRQPIGLASMLSTVVALLDLTVVGAVPGDICIHKLPVPLGCVCICCLAVQAHSIGAHTGGMQQSSQIPPRLQKCEDTLGDS